MRKNVKPDATNIKSATKHANDVHYDYNFASDGDSNKGVVSFYDVGTHPLFCRKPTKHLRTGNVMGIRAIRNHAR